MSGAGNMPPPNGGADLDRLIGELSGGLKPVRRMLPPSIQAVLWLILPLVIGAGLLLFAHVDFAALAARLLAVPDMWLANGAAVLTAILATIAAFMLGRPDRGAGWAWLPVPTTIVWIAASGLGCLRETLLPGTVVLSLGEATDCLMLIVTFAIPLSLLMIWMLLRTASSFPSLTATMAGLACASASAMLLELIHPVDAAATDLIVHGIAVAIVILVNRKLGGKIFQRI